MTEANDQPTPFDQDLITVEEDDYTFGDATAWGHTVEALHRFADKWNARLAAERQAAPVPSDEMILAAAKTLDPHAWRDDIETYPKFMRRVLEFRQEHAINQAREALTAPGNALEAPEGWSMSSIADCQESDDEGEVIRTYYDCELYRERDEAEVSATGPTWQEALAAAVAQAKATTEDESHGHN